MTLDDYNRLYDNSSFGVYSTTALRSNFYFIHQSGRFSCSIYVSRPERDGITDELEQICMIQNLKAVSIDDIRSYMCEFLNVLMYFYDRYYRNNTLSDVKCTYQFKISKHSEFKDAIIEELSKYFASYVEPKIHHSESGIMYLNITI